MANSAAAVKWTKETVKANMVKSDKWVVRGVQAIYALQTFAEQAANATTEDNGVGFNGVDGDFLSNMAKSAEKWGHLTPKQMMYTRKKMLKYSGQLAKIANGTI